MEYGKPRRKGPRLSIRAARSKKKKPGGGVGSVSAHSNFHRSNTYTAVVYHIRVYKYNNASDGPKAIVSRASSPPPRQQHLDSIITYVFFHSFLSLSPSIYIYVNGGAPWLPGCKKSLESGTCQYYHYYEISLCGLPLVYLEIKRRNTCPVPYTHKAYLQENGWRHFLLSSFLSERRQQRPCQNTRQ